MACFNCERVNMLCYFNYYTIIHLSSSKKNKFQKSYIDQRLEKKFQHKMAAKGSILTSQKFLRTLRKHTHLPKSTFSWTRLAASCFSSTRWASLVFSSSSRRLWTSILKTSEMRVAIAFPQYSQKTLTHYQTVQLLRWRTKGSGSTKKSADTAHNRATPRSR